MSGNHTQIKYSSGPANNQAVQAGNLAYSRYLDPTESSSHLDAALDAYAQALEQEPVSAGIMAKMAILSLRKGNTERARQLAEKALRANSKESLAHFTLGYIAFKANHFEACIPAFRQTVQSNRLGSFKAHLFMAHAYRKRAKSNFGSMMSDMLKSWGHLLCVALLFPIDRERRSVAELLPLVLGLVVGYYFDEQHRWDDALRTYLSLYERFPGAVSLTNAIGDVYRKKNCFTEALYWYDKTIARHPSSEEAYFSKAQMLEDRNEPEKALDVYEKLHALCPNDPHVLCSIANAYYSCHQFEDALAYYKSALMLGQDREWRGLIAQSIGNLYLDCFNNYEAAQAAFQMALDLDDSDVENYIQLGLVYFKNKDYKNATVIYQQAISRFPTNARLYSNLGYLKWQHDDLTEAEKLYQKAITLDPFYEIPYNNLGVIYLDSLGKIPQALECLEKAVSLNDRYALAFYNLGRAYSFLNRKLHAATCFKTAQSLNTHTRELDNDELAARIEHLFAASEPEEPAA